MDLANIGLLDLMGLFVGLILTLMVFSYIFGDNFLFRIAMHIFIGVAAGYSLVIITYNVIWPQLVLPLLRGNYATVVALILGLLLLTKASARFSGLGGPVMAYLVGVGAAAAVGGAVLGTLFPQVKATWNLFDLAALSQSGDMLGHLFNGSIILVGASTTLVYFHFGARAAQGKTVKRAPWIEIIAWIGQAFIAITFGALFAGAYIAALVALIERWNFIVKFVLSLFSP